MIAYLLKSVTWIVTFVVAVGVGVSALIVNQPESGAISPRTWWSWPPPPHHHPPPAVPEVNTGLVLVPIVLAILLFTSRHFIWRGRAASR
jgi:hypothetical protein